MKNYYRILTAVMVFVLVCSFLPTVTVFAEDTTESYWWEQYVENPEEDLRAPGVNENGQVVSKGGYILFTSDTHSTTFLEKDLLEMANRLVQEDTGDPDAYVGLAAIGGDYSDSGLLPDVMTILKHAITDTSPETVAVYTKGNHESRFSEEEFLEITGMPRIGETAVNEDGLYYFYSFGVKEMQTFTQDDIDKLAEYLAAHNDGKPIFILSHFPIHYLTTMRNVYEAGGKELIELLNKYPQVVFTWGHNHSEADPCYGTVRFPGETINYGPDLEDTMGLRFTYLCNGSLRYGVNDENGVLVKVNDDGSLYFRFLSLETYAADGRRWSDSQRNAFEALVSGECRVIASRTLPALDDEYFRTINAAQIIVDEPWVGDVPDSIENVREYDDRFHVTDVEWFADGELMSSGEVFDFDTLYSVNVVLQAEDGYTMADNIMEQNNIAINPTYHGPMDENYYTGVDTVSWIDDTAIMIGHTYESTISALDNPVSPADEIIEGHEYVMVSVDDTDTSLYFRYEYQDGARRQNNQPRVNRVVIIDGKLYSSAEPFEQFAALYDDQGYLLWTDASLLDQGHSEESAKTINILTMQVSGKLGSIGVNPGEISVYNNWNVDENCLPYINVEGMRVYPCTDGEKFSGTTDPEKCNMRLFDVGEAGSDHYIVVGNVTAPVTGETPDTGTSGKEVTWSPADETFQPDTAYTAIVKIEMDTPVTDRNAAIGRMNGKDVNLSLSEDGLTAVLTFTFPMTNVVSEPVDATAKRVDNFENGKTYIIATTDGTAVTSMSTADGRFLLGAQINADEDTITEGITKEMLFTMESSDTDNAFRIRSSRGYLTGRREKEFSQGTWGIDFSDERGIRVSYEDGKIYVRKGGGMNGLSSGDRRMPSECFYLYEGHFNYGDFNDGSDFIIYEVSY